VIHGYEANFNSICIDNYKYWTFLLLLQPHIGYLTKVTDKTMYKSFSETLYKSSVRPIIEYGNTVWIILLVNNQSCKKVFVQL